MTTDIKKRGFVAETGTIRLTAAQALVRFLQEQWSERDGEKQRLIPAVMAIFGHGNLYGIGQALEEYGHDFTVYQGKNEQSMVHAAIGYAKAKRRLSTLAVSASIGPGSTNMVSGAATATVNRIPVLLLAGDTFANRLQGPVLQALEHPAERDLTANDTLRPVSRFFDRISRPEQLLTSLPEAMRVLTDPADTGAVTICLHQDVQGEAYEFPTSFFEPRTWAVLRRSPHPDEITKAAELIKTATRPLIIAGGGVRYSGAEEALAQFGNRHSIPVCETYAGKGVAAGAEMNVGGLGLGGTQASTDLAAEADLVIAVGSRLTDVVTGSNSAFQNPKVRFIGLNVCASDAHKLGAIAVVGDAKAAIIGISGAIDGYRCSPGYSSDVEGRRKRWLEMLDGSLADRDGERMSQGQVLRALNEHAVPDDVLIGSAGTVPVDVLKLWECRESASCLLEFGFSCMGHDIPAAIGVRLARGDRGDVFVFMGDGNYLMSNPEIVTAVQEGLKVTVIVIENGGFQSIRGSQDTGTGRSFATEFRKRDQRTKRLDGAYLGIDFASNARSLGCAAYDTTTINEFREALVRSRSDNQAVVIVAHVERHRYLPDSGMWWDIGIAEHSERPEVRQLAEDHHSGARRLQRFYYRAE